MTALDVRQVAGWDVPALRCGLARLDGVADRLPASRGRVEAVGHQLSGAWRGPAADTAAAAVMVLARTAAVVAAALDDSLIPLARLAREATDAQESAERAVVLAAAQAVPLSPSGAPAVPLPVPRPAMAPDQAGELLGRLRAAAEACAERALQHAALAAAAADEATEALRAVGVVGRGRPAGFGDLAVAAGTTRPLPLPALPTGRAPHVVAAWWAALGPAERAGALAGEAVMLGGLDGLPAAVRDRANRQRLAAVLASPSATGHDTAVVVAGQLAREERGARPVQLLEFDPAAGLVAVGLGDLDSAGAIGVLVPGIFTTPRRDLGDLLEEARDVAGAAEAAAPALAVATVAWLGYRSPASLGEAATSGDARRGGAALDRTLAGLAAGRTAGGGRPARTTVVAHSYGTVVAHEAARRPGRLAADAVVLLGSPGMGWDGARGLESPEVYDAWSPADPVSYLGWFGQDPQSRGYGAVELPVAPGTPHTGYFAADRPTLAAVGRVIAGRTTG